MTPRYRRGSLFAIFYYRSPEARDRRIQKVVDEAIVLTEKKSSK
jgi:hypothetical protein